MDGHAEEPRPAEETTPPADGAGQEATGAEAPRPDPAAVREAIDRLVAAGLGAVGATADRAESFLGSSGSGQRLGERASAAISGLLDDLGLVKRERFDELELKVAQLEHRLRLLEEGGSHQEPPPPGS